MNRVSDFCTALIQQADKTGAGLKWARFISRRAVEHELTRRGYELCEESADFDPTKKRFFAMKLEVPIRPEYP